MNTAVWKTHLCGAGRCQDGSRRRGFTLVELLVVIAIIGTLVGLLLPAVQSARESARRTDCSSKMKQVMLAAINFHEARGAFPCNNTGTPNVLNSNVLLKGEGPHYTSGGPTSKSYGWLVFVLPFMEESATHDRIDFSVAPTNSANVALRTTLIPAFACPSDPYAMYDNPIARANASTATGSTTGMDGGVCGETGTGDTGMQSQRYRGQFCSYHGSAGDGYENNVTGFCGSTGYVTYGCGAAADGPASGVYGGYPGPSGTNPGRYRGFHSFRNADNIGYTNLNGSPRLPRQTAALVTDGLSSTIFLGHASTNSTYRGNGAAFYGPQCVKTTAVPIYIGNICPKLGVGFANTDTPRTACSSLAAGNMMGFSSHHGPDLPVAMADGSVRWLNETIDQKTYNAMGSKNGVVDGYAAEARIVVD